MFEPVFDHGLLAFSGKVNRNSPGNTFQIDVFDMSFGREQGAGTTDFDVGSNQIYTDASGLFGNNGQKVLDGFVVKGTETSLYDGMPGSPVNQPLVRTVGVQPQPVATSGQMLGFSAGFIATIDPDMPGTDYTSSNVVANGWDSANSSYGVAFTKNAANGTVSGDVKLGKQDVSGATVNDYSGSSYVQASFGGASQADSVLVSNSTFIAKQKSLSNTNLGGAAGAVFTDPSKIYGVAMAMPGNSIVRDDGTLVPSTASVQDQMANPVLLGTMSFDQAKAAMNCTRCQFTTWGVWAGSSQGVITGDPIDQVAHMIPFVVGTPTENLNNLSPVLAGNLNYAGQVIGHTQNSGVGDPIVPRAGYFTAVVNMGTPDKKLTNLDIRFAGQRFGYAPGSGGTNFPGGGKAYINNVPLTTIDQSGTAVTTGTYLIDGKANVALFGPQAQNIGGNFVAKLRDIPNSVNKQTMTGILRGGR